jgi:uncharacterized membrane protein HdeD (DUF308 family)
MTVMPGARRGAVVSNGSAGPWCIFEGVTLMFLGLATALAPRLADLDAARVLGWTMVLTGLLAGTAAIWAQRRLQPAPRAIGAAAALALGGLALRMSPTDGAALSLLIVGFLCVDAAALVAASWLRRRHAAAGAAWLTALAAFDLLLAAWLAGLHAMLGPGADGFAIAARLILGGMTLVGLGVAAMEAA